MRTKVNPVKSRRKPPRKPRSKLVTQYREPLKRLRQLGIDPLPGVPLERIKRLDQIPEAKRKAITRLYSEYDYLFSRPHVVADFSLPEDRVRREYFEWKKRTAETLRREGYSKREADDALRGTYDEFKTRREAQNRDRLLAAQEFAGHHILDANLKAAVIPVITGAPQRVRLKFDKSGRPFLKEKNVSTYNVPIDPLKLARGKRAYLEKILSGYTDQDRFLIMTGDYMSIKNSGDRKGIIEKVLRLMGRYDSKKAGKEHYWKNWMMGIRVLRGTDVVEAESARQGFEALRQRMKAERRAEFEKHNKDFAERKRALARDRKRRQRVRDNFID